MLFRYAKKTMKGRESPSPNNWHKTEHATLRKRRNRSRRVAVHHLHGLKSTGQVQSGQGIGHRRAVGQVQNGRVRLMGGAEAEASQRDGYHAGYLTS